MGWRKVLTAWAVAAALLVSAGTAAAKPVPEEVLALQKKAGEGDVQAQFDLAEVYFKGREVDKDRGEAAKWYQKAAEQGHALAQYNLAQMYHQGRGVPQNVAEAVKWFQAAAEQGETGSQLQLGLMFLKGDGVPQDPVQSYKWFDVVSAELSGPQGAVAVSTRDAIAASMTPEQVAEAQRLSAEWKAAHPPKP